MSKIPYRQILGSIRYLVTGAHPDLCYASGFLSRFMHNPGIAHWTALKRLLRYLQKTRSAGLQYTKTSSLSQLSALLGWSDSDRGGNLDNRHSTAGHLFILAGGAITWQSKQQSSVTLSTAEAEVKKDYYAPALGGIMLSIGIQLSVQDFALILQRPMPILVGYMAQYIAKPLLGLLVARIFCMPTVFAAGFILTACVAGAQLSSYASYLSEGDVALSIVLTSLTTITSVIVTPLLTGLLLGSVIPVDGYAMAKSIMQVVLCPVLLGLALNTYAKPFVDKIRPFMPIMAMLCTSLCIGSPLALNRSSIASIQGLRLLFPVLAFHLSALAVGYWISKVPLWRQEEKACRTLSLCTGMQSSTLAGLLATQFLGGSHAVAPASSVVVMAVLGLGLASFWGKGHQIQTIWLGSGGKIKPFCRLI